MDLFSKPEPSGRRTTARMWMFGAAAALIGSGMMVWITQRGIGLQPDSAFYFDAAENLLAGRGYATALHSYLDPESPDEYLKWFETPGGSGVEPQVVFPPLYSLCLAGLAELGLSIPDAARWLSVFLFGLNVGMIVLLIGRYGGGTPGFLGFGALIIVFAEGFVEAHANALSEPLFIGLTLIGLAGLALYVEGGSAVFFGLAAVALGLSVLARYAGAASLLTGGVALLLLSARPRRRRIRDFFLFGLLAGAPILAFSIHNAIHSGSATGRRLEVILPGWEFFRHLGTTLSSWLFPHLHRLAPNPEVVAGTALLAGVLLAAGFASARKAFRRPAGASPRPAVFAVHFFVYILFFCVTAFFLQADIDPDRRILLPLYICLAAIVPFLLLDFRFALGAGWPRRIATAAAAVYLLGYLGSGLGWAQVSARSGSGLGYRTAAWNSPEMRSAAAALERESRSNPVFANDIFGVYFLCRGRAYPCSFDPAALARPALAAFSARRPVVFALFETRAPGGRTPGDEASLEEAEAALLSSFPGEVLVRAPSVFVYKTRPAGGFHPFR
jgi:hypothetical protein